MAVAAQGQFQSAFAAYVPVAGLLTDELQANERGPTPLNGAIDSYTAVDARLLDQTTDWYGSRFRIATDNVYGQLQQARGALQEAIGALAVYAPDSLHALRGEMYALQGYTEVMLADLFCGGVPLSTLDFSGDYTYQPGATTEQVYQHAIALFDTAQILATDSIPIKYLAEVGKGRAFLALGQYVTAGQTVSEVPLTFIYADSVLTCGNAAVADIGNSCPGFYSQTPDSIVTSFALFQLPLVGSVADNEGGVGLAFISNGDPRSAVTELGTTDQGFQIFFPTKYNPTGISAIPLATGVEAQLITAEATLQAGGGSRAIEILNSLRQSQTLNVNLPALTDPGIDSARVDMLFRERAAWLFVDGHRQGDLRRLVRNYHWTNVYPSGGYPGVGAYGVFVDAPIPKEELANPLFHGCLNRD
jgi:hypothetical protein